MTRLHRAAEETTARASSSSSERLKEGDGERVDRNMEKARADCPVSSGGRAFGEPASTAPLVKKSLGLGATGWTHGGCGSRKALAGAPCNT